MTIHDIFPVYKNDLALVEKNLREIFSSDAALLPVIGEHIIG